MLLYSSYVKLAHTQFYADIFLLVWKKKNALSFAAMPEYCSNTSLQESDNI